MSVDPKPPEFLFGQILERLDSGEKRFAAIELSMPDRNKAEAIRLAVCGRLHISRTDLAGALCEFRDSKRTIPEAVSTFTQEDRRLPSGSSRR